MTETGTDDPGDRARILEVVESWAVARDAGLWPELQAAWHDDGRMNTTWMRGTADEFVRACAASFEAGATVHHLLGGSLVRVAGPRAVAQTKTTITLRTAVHGVLCDITCTGRFYDFFERRHGLWRIVLRQPIYEKDRLDPVAAGPGPAIDRAVLDGYPDGCRHLLYAQQSAGGRVLTDVPGLRGEAVTALYAHGDAWLHGAALPVALTGDPPHA